MSTSIHQEIEFDSSPDRLYRTLLNEKEFSELTGSTALIDSEAGGSFSSFDGQITGRHIELIPDKRIVQAWRVGIWEEGLYSIVKIELTEKGSETMLILDHTGVPENMREHLDKGWYERYWEPLKKYVS